jgi:DNA-binding CsgD family transcriptional regulator
MAIDRLTIPYKYFDITDPEIAPMVYSAGEPNTQFGPRLFGAIVMGGAIEYTDAAEEVFTLRERQVSLLACLGMPNYNIGKLLCVSETTVKTHIGNVFSKTYEDLQRRGRSGLLHWMVTTKQPLMQVTAPATSSLQLTPAQFRIADSIKFGDTNEVIAKKNNCSYSTVGTHIQRMYKRSGIRTRELIAASMIVQPNEAADSK